MQAIPTYYKGILFRSRLESKWAIFFDMLKWPWVYEPFDLPGYIPDFVLRFPKPLLVEVKPVLHINDTVYARDKIDGCGWDKEALVVGAAFPLLDGLGPVIGALREDDDNKWGTGCLFKCKLCEQISILHLEHSWLCRVCGGSDGDHNISEADNNFLSAAWAISTNLVRWIPKK